MAIGKDIKAGRAWVELMAKENLKPGFTQPLRRMRTFGRVVATIGAGIFAGSTAAAASLAIPLKIFESMGIQLDDMSKRTGLSVESLSGLGRAAARSGSSVEDLERGINGLQCRLTAAAQGNKSQAEAFARVGLSARGLAALDPERQFLAVADALAQIEDPARRAAEAQQLLGAAGKQLLPMMEDGAAGIQAAIEEFRRLGLIVSTADAALAANFGRTVGLVWDQVKMLAFQVGAALAPALLELLRVAQPVLAWTIGFIRENRGAVLAVTGFIGSLMALGAALVTVGVGLQMLSWLLTLISLKGVIATAVMAAFGAVLAVITSPITAVVVGLLAAAAATIALIAWITGLGPAFIGAARTALSSIGQLLGGMFDALLGGDLTLAFDILLAGLALAWLHLTVSMQDAFFRFTTSVLGMAGSIKDALHQMWISVKEMFTGQDLTLERIGVEVAGLERAKAALAALNANNDLNQAQIDLAQKHLDELLKRAKEARAKWDQPHVPAFNVPEFALSETLGRLAVGNGGAFNAAAAANLGRTSSIEEKMLEELEGIGQNADELARAARDGGLVFV